MRGGSKTQLTLIYTEALVDLTLPHKTVPTLALRACTVFACAEGENNKTVFTRQRMQPQIACKWRRRHVWHRLEGFLDAPRCRVPGTFDYAQVDGMSPGRPRTCPIGPRQRRHIANHDSGTFWCKTKWDGRRIDHVLQPTT